MRENNIVVFFVDKIVDNMFTCQKPEVNMFGSSLASGKRIQLLKVKLSRIRGIVVFL